MKQKLAKSIAVIIVNFNNWKDTIACAESVLASNFPPRFVFIVDNASTDDSACKLQEWGQAKAELPKFGGFQKIFDMAHITEESDAQIILIHSPHNKGYAAGNNHGIKLAMAWGADAIWILNNDTVVEPEALGAMQECLFNKKRPGLCGSLICYMDTGLVQCCAGGKTNPWTGLSQLYGYSLTRSEALQHTSAHIEGQINFIYGASVMASKDFIQTVGLMDERYFLYCEEQDWAYSAKGRFDFAYAPSAIVHHKEGSTTGFSSKKMSVRSLWYLMRSRILLTCKHKIWALPTVLLSILFAGLRMVWRRVAAH